jgi:hypothetical protein
MEVNDEYQIPATLLLGRNPCTPWIRGWVRPRVIPDISDNRLLFPVGCHQCVVQIHCLYIQCRNEPGWKYGFFYRCTGNEMGHRGWEDMAHTGQCGL